MKTIPETIPGRNGRFQLLFWTTLLLFTITKDASEFHVENFTEIVAYDCCHLVFEVLTANYIFYILVQRYLFKKNYWRFASMFLVSIYILAVLNRIFIIYIAEPFFIQIPQDSLKSIFTDFRYLFFNYILSLLTGSFLFIAVMMMLGYKTEKERNTQLLKEKAELELRSLKAQLNPHFLFNTLNNIYALSLMQSELTPVSISRLSEILAYILYQGQKKLIEIEEELKIIQDYIALEQLRYSERLQIRLHTSIEVNNPIPPLILVSLVENAFKHGAARVPEDFRIDIQVHSDGAGTRISVDNNCLPESAAHTVGIGLVNIREQLRLLYDKSFSMITNRTSQQFSIALTLPAHAH